MFYVGLDVALKAHQCVILDNDGEKIARSLKFDSNQSGFAKLKNYLDGFNRKPESFVIGMEATGSLWENLYQFLQNNHYDVRLLNPLQTSRFRDVANKKAKTDDLDAIVIAGLLRTNHAVSCYVPDEEIQSMRELVRLKNSFQDQLKNTKRKFISLLTVTFPELQGFVKNIFNKIMLQILKKYPTAKDIAQLQPKHILKIARSIQGNNFDDSKAKKIIDLAKNSIYSGKARQARGYATVMLAAHIQSLMDNVEELEENIQNILKPKSNDRLTPPEILESIPGVGKKTIATLIAELGNISRFSTCKQLVGYLGLFPNISESGSYKNPHPRLSKRGPRLARKALYMASVACLKHNQELRELYLKKLSQGKAVKQALIVVARKLVAIIFGMLKSNTFYTPARVFVRTHY